MSEKQWYEKLFENYAKKYEKESFTQGTIGECDFIEQELAYNKSLKILDVGCGTGRHAIELTKRGYHVIGIDLSESQLARAKEKAKEEGVVVDFQKQDARNLRLDTSYDVAIMLCEGGFPLMETDEMNYEILKSNERYYVPSEITWLLKLLGYQKIDIFGAKLGAFSRKDKLTTEDFEMLVMAEK